MCKMRPCWSASSWSYKSDGVYRAALRWLLATERPMDFRLTLKIERFTALEDVGTFTLKDPPATVSLTRPRANQLRDEPGRENQLCTVEASCNVTPDLQAALDSVDPTIETIAFNHFPVEIQAEIADVRGKMSRAARDVVDQVRWKLTVYGPHNPLKFRSFAFRSSSGAWRSMSQELQEHLIFDHPY